MPKPEPKLETWLLDKFIPDPEELDRHDDPEEIRLKGLDMLARGQLQPLAALEDGTMIFGHGRYLAAKSAGIKTLEVKVYPAMDRSQLLLIRTSENLKRKSLSPYRTHLLFSELIAALGCNQKELAAKMCVNEATVCRNLSPSRCIPEAVEALKAGEISLSGIYAISKLKQEEQGGLLAFQLLGANRDQAEEEGRRQRNGAGKTGTPPERSARVKIPLSVSTKETEAHGTVTVASLPGAEIDLSEVETLLKEALRAVREAQNKNWGLKAAQATWRDMAAAN